MRIWLLASLLGCLTLSGRAQESPPRDSLRVLVYNVKHGLGMDGRIDLDRLAARIRATRPDIVALQEVDRGCGRSGGVDQAAWLGERLGMHAAFGAFMDYDGGEDAASTLVLIGDSDLKLIERLMVGDSVMAHHF